MPESGAIQTDEIAHRAAGAAAVYARLSPAVRARALVAVADAVEAASDELIPVAQRETGLSDARLRGELTRTAVQLRMFANVVVDGGYLDVRIDDVDPAFVLGTRPDVRRYHIPLGPVLNFAASNFPFAFSVIGGDSAAALAAGCSVVLKAHPGHPELSRRTAAVVREALRAQGVDEDVFQFVEGQQMGVELLQHPAIKGASFTGSIAAGRLLADIAAARPAPIPFFGELGSVNPVFVTSAAVRERPAALVTGLMASVSGSAGQLCTKPGFVFLPRGHGLEGDIRAAVDGIAEHRMLNPSIARSFDARRSAVAESDGVISLVDRAVRYDADGEGWATPSVFTVAADRLAALGDAVLDESFGPLVVLVEYGPEEDLAVLASTLFQGNLTATVHLGDGETGPRITELVNTLTGLAGRVLFDGWPTGVAVTPAMQHGGPWPATTNDSSTAVGTAAISRFLRPVAFQSCPAAILPEPLRDDNPWDIPQTRSAAGESHDWGTRAR